MLLVPTQWRSYRLCDVTSLHVLCEMQPLKLAKKLDDAELDADETFRQQDSGTWHFSFVVGLDCFSTF